VTCAVTGSQSELQALAIHPATRFSSLFDTAKVGPDGRCLDGFSAANPPSPYYQTKVNGRIVYVHCLRIKVGGAGPCMSAAWTSPSSSSGHQ